MSTQERREKAAPCGLYCGACHTYIACERGDEVALEAMAKRMAETWGREIDPQQDLMCAGCLSSQVAVFCRQCSMRACASERGITYCAQCSDFPCETIINFNNDGRPHHSEVLANVRRQQEIGLEAWLEEQDRRWRCSECGCAIGWYDTECSECSAGLPQQFQ